MFRASLAHPQEALQLYKRYTRQNCVGVVPPEDGQVMSETEALSFNKVDVIVCIKLVPVIKTTKFCLGTVSVTLY
jgi:hypothetical protein